MSIALYGTHNSATNGSVDCGHPHQPLDLLIELIAISNPSKDAMHMVCFLLGGYLPCSREVAFVHINRASQWLRGSTRNQSPARLYAPGVVST